MPVVLAAVFLGAAALLRGDDASSLWAQDNLVAWCAAPPWDAKQRNSEERAQMLQDLGFRYFAFNWRDKNIPTFDAEIEALDRHHIKLLGWAVYGAKNPAVKDIFAAFKRHGVHTELWDMETGMKPAQTPAEQQERINEVVARVLPLAREAEACGCQVELYNHNGWCGIEDNQLAVIRRLKTEGVNVGMVYNFSHAHDAAHDDTVNFPALWNRIKSHVVEVNITGMGPDWKKEIYPSQGDRELGMMRTIEESGWRGPVGVIAEKGGDAAVTLKRYVIGLDWLAAELKRPGSGGPRPFGVAQ